MDTLQQQEREWQISTSRRLESERKALWATCRLKGLAKETPERRRIAELDRLIAEHKGRKSG